MESELGLGELAGLTVANEADSLAYDVSTTTRTRWFFSPCCSGSGQRAWKPSVGRIDWESRSGGGKNPINRYSMMCSSSVTRHLGLVFNLAIPVAVAASATVFKMPLFGVLFISRSSLPPSVLQCAFLHLVVSHLWPLHSTRVASLKWTRGWKTMFCYVLNFYYVEISSEGLSGEAAAVWETEERQKTLMRFMTWFWTH